MAVCNATGPPFVSIYEASNSNVADLPYDHGLKARDPCNETIGSAERTVIKDKRDYR